MVCRGNQRVKNEDPKHVPFVERETTLQRRNVERRGASHTSLRSSNVYAQILKMEVEVEWRN